MPEYSIRIHPAALAEASVARDWYTERNDIAAEAFLAELDHAISQVVGSPLQWPRFDHGTRRYVFPRFPFNLVYRVNGDFVEVLAIAHQKKKPGYWWERT